MRKLCATKDCELLPYGGPWCGDCLKLVSDELKERWCAVQSRRTANFVPDDKWQEYLDTVSAMREAIREARELPPQMSDVSV